MTNKPTRVWSKEALEWFVQAVIDRARLEYSKRTTFVFEDIGKLYSVNMDAIPAAWVSLDTQEDGVTLQGRIRIHTKDKHTLRNRRDCKLLGNAEKLTAMAHDQYKRATGKEWPKRKNFGWVAEFAIWNNIGRGDQWKPDNREFWLYPDIDICGNTYQIKGENAEYFNESNIEKARKWEASKGL